MELHTIGIDLGKTVFHLVGLNLRGEVVVRKKNCLHDFGMAVAGGVDRDAGGEVEELVAIDIDDAGAAAGNVLAMHPTVKPIAMIADALLNRSAQGEIVIDSFLGSGSTLLAAERAGVSATASKSNPDKCSSFDNNDLERVREDGRSRMRDCLSRCGYWPKLRCRQVHATGRSVDRHGMSTKLCLHCLDNGKARLTRIHDSQGSIASIRRECHAAFWIKARAIWRISDDSQAQDYSGFVIDHNHFFSITDGKESMLFTIDRHSAG
jgi:hypothetical protein